MNRRRDISAAILAGGESSRMGRDKALLDLDGKPFISRVAEALSEEFEAVSIISDHADRYRFLGLPVYQDLFKRCGPLGGIHSALRNSPTTKVFVASCDIPFIDRQVIQYLLRACGNEEVTIFSRNNLTEPLCGVYDSRILPAIELHLGRGQFSVRTCLADLKTVHITPPSGETTTHALANINTPAEYRHYCTTGES